MHVKDAVSAFETILHKGTTKEIYNIGALEARTRASKASNDSIIWVISP